MDIVIALVRIVFIFLFLVFFTIKAKAYRLEVIVLDNNFKAKELPDYKSVVKDSVEAKRISFQLITALHQQSYIAAQVDTFIFVKDTLKAFIFVGEKHSWVSLRKGNVDGYLLDRSGFRERMYRNKPFRFKEYNKLEQTFIRISENNGFPFASIQLDSLSFLNGGLSASLNYKKGPFFTFDSIAIIGKTKTKKRFLVRHIRIYPGQPYSQQRIEEAERLIRELPYLTQMRAPEIVFSKNKAILNLFLADKKVNQIDGIIGFLPGEGKSKKLLVTGELNIGLRNLFGTGKSLNLEWKKIKQASQLLNANYIHPKLLGSSTDVKVDFNLFKQDSTFLTIIRNLTFIQRTGTYSKVSFFGGLKTSRPLNGVYDTSAIKFANYNHYTYGLGYERNQLDNIFYPRKGWLFSVLGYLGNKTIQPDPSFNPLYYEGTKLKSVQFNAESFIERYSKLGKGGVVLTRLAVGSIFNDKSNIYFNDLYRIGGLKTLRGFNQNNFYASSYAVATLEYRFFTDETSYLMLFYDQGYLKNELSLVAKDDYPKGFGAGVSFTTAAGVFNFVYSLGSSRDQKLNLNLSKIHFGIISRF